MNIIIRKMHYEILDSIPGFATRMAEQILSEIGTDVKKQFLIIHQFNKELILHPYKFIKDNIYSFRKL
jgi:Holliday junction resolvasome RuvABC DNA-binding subunit